MLPQIKPYTLDPHQLPPNTTSWEPDPDRAVLLIHDMQKHFVQAFHADQDSQIQIAVSNINKLRQYASKHHLPVVYTAQPPHQKPEDRQLLTDFWGSGLSDAQNAEIIGDLTPTPSDTVLTKWRYCAFYRTDLDDRMRNHAKDQLWITGVYSHIGCLTTALTAFMKGYKVFFIGDAQADFSEQEHLLALKYVASRCGQVTATDHLLATLQNVRRPVAVSNRQDSK